MWQKSNQLLFKKISLKEKARKCENCWPFFATLPPFSVLSVRTALYKFQLWSHKISDYFFPQKSCQSLELVVLVFPIYYSNLSQSSPGLILSPIFFWILFFHCLYNNNNFVLIGWDLATSRSFFILFKLLFHWITSHICNFLMFVFHPMIDWALEFFGTCCSSISFSCCLQLLYCSTDGPSTFFQTLPGISAFLHSSVLFF